MTLYIVFAYVHQEWFSRIIKTTHAWKLLIVNLGKYLLLYAYRFIYNLMNPFLTDAVQVNVLQHQENVTISSIALIDRTKVIAYRKKSK